MPCRARASCARPRDACAPACLVRGGLPGRHRVAQAEEKYSFDVGKFEKKPFELSGYAELRQEHFRLDRKGVPYKLNFYDRDVGKGLDGTIGVLEVSGLYRQGIATFQATVHGDALTDDLHSTARGRTYEAYLTLEPARDCGSMPARGRCAGARATPGTRWDSSSARRIPTIRSFRARDTCCSGEASPAASTAPCRR